VVVGAGGAGLRAVVGCSEAWPAHACYPKVFPTRSHTVAREAALSASLATCIGRLALAHVRHRQGVGLAGDQDAFEYMVRNAPKPFTS
jgi:succinate dehydrogenase / fumarate reductase flavoprotein subunit